MNRNTGLIATIASAVLCGCPGLFLCIFGAVTAAGQMPYSVDINGVSQTGTMPASYGAVMLCLALIFILIPVVIGVVTLRNKPAAAPIVTPPPPPSEPMPPAS